MKRLAVIAGALAALAAPSAQAQPGVFAAFQDVCLSTHGDGKAALARADATGWMPVPAPLLKQLDSEDGFHDVKARLRSTETSMEMVLVARMEATIRKIPVSFQFCAVATLPPQPEFKAQLINWTGVSASPDLSGKGRVGYVFIEDGERHRPIEADSSNTLKLLRDGRVRVTAVQEDKEMTMALYAIPIVNENP